MVEPILAHGSGVDDVGIFVVGGLLVAGFALTVRRMRQMEAQDRPAPGDAETAEPGADERWDDRSPWRP